MTATDSERDELLLQSLMDLIPTPGTMAALIQTFETSTLSAENAHVVAMLKGYGTLLNVIQAATELEGSLTDRLYGGYYELTNNEGDED